MVDDIEVLLKRLTISFPEGKAITLEETTDMLEFVAGKLGPETRITYTVTTIEGIQPERNEEGKATGRHYRDRGGTQTLEGSITSAQYQGDEKVVGTTNFHMEPPPHARRKPRTYGELQFSTLGYETVREIREPELQIIDQTRTAINEWFKLERT